MNRNIRSMALVLVMLAAIAAAPAGASIGTGTGMYRSIYVGWYEATPNGFITGYLIVDQSAGAGTVDTAATPTANFTAGGAIYTYTSTPCCSSSSVNIPQQSVSPTALSMDPLGNSARFVATLTSNFATHAFDLTLVEPSSLMYGPPCTNGCINAWHNPTNNSVGATNYNGVGWNRWNYEVTGSADGLPLTPSGYSDGFSFTSVAAGQAATAP